MAISVSENQARKNATLSEVFARLEKIMEIKSCSISEAAHYASVGKSLASKIAAFGHKMCSEGKKLVDANPAKLGISIAYPVSTKATSDQEQVRLLKAVLDGKMTRDDVVRELSRSAKRKRISLDLTIEGIAIKLGIPENAQYDKLLTILSRLRSKLLAEQKHGTPIAGLPLHLNGKAI